MFLVLAFSLTAWRNSQNARRLINNTASKTTEKTVASTEAPTVKAVENPVSDVPDTRQSTTEESTVMTLTRKKCSPEWNWKIARKNSSSP